MTFVSVDAGSGILPKFCFEIDVTNDATNPTRVWTDCSPLVRQAQLARSGRNDELQQSATGSAALLLDDRHDAITGLGLKTGHWMRVRGQWNSTIYPRWQGIIEAAPRQWPSAGHDAIVQLRAAGVFKILNLYDLVGQTFASQRNDQRVAAIAALAGVTTGSIDTDTDAADAIVAAFSQGSAALNTLLALEQSENGTLIEDPTGTISFQGRHWRLMNSATSRGTFGEGPTDIPYRDTVELANDDTLQYNQVSVTGADGATTETIDLSGSDWARGLSRQLATSDDTIILAAAQYLANRHALPSPRLPQIDVQLAAVSIRHSANVATLLAANNSDRFTWDRAATTPISDDVYIEQVVETITPGAGWDMSFQLSPASDDLGWPLGDAVNSLLGETTALIY